MLSEVFRRKLKLSNYWGTINILVEYFFKRGYGSEIRRG